METDSLSYKVFQLYVNIWGWFKAIPGYLVAKAIDFARNAKKLGNDDPRRVIHSIKVGLALTLVSLFYYSQPLYDGFGVSAMWAVMTVVVVFEYTVGATIGKGLNRVMATLLAGALGVGAHHLASISGKIGEPILIGFFVFLQAAIATFIRFFPKIKARYDYGVLIFILTFCLISVSSYRNDGILDFAHKRVTTVVIGTFTCVIISISVCPVWAGEELHDQVELNIEVLANFLEGFGDEHCETSNKEGRKEDKTFLQAYKSVLHSKSKEETMANFARWEPGHGPFSYNHPWKHYLKIGSQVRECANLVQNLSCCLVSKISSDININFKETCINMSSECGKALSEAASSMKNMSTPSSADRHIENSKAAQKNLQCLFQSCLWDHENSNEIVPVAVVSSVLRDIVTCTEKIVESVHELAFIAHFSTKSTIVKPLDSLERVSGMNLSHIMVAVNGPTPDCLRIGNSCTISKGNGV